MLALVLMVTMLTSMLVVTDADVDADAGASTMSVVKL